MHSNVLLQRLQYHQLRINQPLQVQDLLDKVLEIRWETQFPIEVADPHKLLGVESDHEGADEALDDLLRWVLVVLRVVESFNVKKQELVAFLQRASNEIIHRLQLAMLGTCLLTFASLG